MKAHLRVTKMLEESYITAYVSEVIEATILCIKYGAIDKREAIKAVEDIIKRCGRMRRDVELALESLIEFRRQLEEEILC